MPNFKASYDALTAYKNQSWKAMNEMNVATYAQVEEFLLDTNNYYPQYRDHVRPVVTPLLKSFRTVSDQRADGDRGQCFSYIRAIFLDEGNHFRFAEIYGSLLDTAKKELDLLLKSVERTIENCCDLENIVMDFEVEGQAKEKGLAAQP